MKYIEKITISNARRLGENVEIDFGSGATIILAPNGTGKTTIFEAVELAMTEQIKRLENSPDAIIRDGLAEMSVHLDFSCDKYLHATYRRGGSYKRSGNYEGLFETENQSSLPYLFRLTHFLEQRSNEWLIDKDANDAGNFLSQLPLGKELQNILSKKQGLLLSIGKTEAIALKNLNESQEKLTRIEALISKRNVLANETALIPLSEIVAEILPISRLTDYEEYRDEPDLVQINSHFEKTKISLKQKKDEKADLNVRLNILKERILHYFSNLELLAQKQIIVIGYSSKITEVSEAVERTRNDLQTSKTKLFDLQNEIKRLNSIKVMFEEFEQQQSQLKIKKSELQLKEKALSELNKSYEMIIEYLKKNERILDQHKMIEDSINEKRSLLNQLEIKMDLQKQWQSLLDTNDELLEKNITVFEKKINNCQEAKSLSDREVSRAENQYLIKKGNLESINLASGAIQEAVGTIRKNLAGNQKNCPVCQAIYEPEDLVRRIENSLSALNPTIPFAIEEEKKALSALREAEEKQRKESQKLQEAISELNSEKSKLEVNQKLISERIQPHFPALKTPLKAKSYIEDQIQQITSEIKNLEAKRNQLEPSEDSDKIDNARLKKGEDERAVGDLIDKIRQLQNEIDSVNLSIERITQSFGSDDRKTILDSISTASIKEDKEVKQINDLETALSIGELQLKEYHETYLLEIEAINKLKASQDGILTEWEQAGLDGLPSQETLELKLKMLKNSIEELEKGDICLNQIEKKLAGWRAAEKFEEINNEVQQQIGNVSEEEYIKTLKSLTDKENATLRDIEKKRDALNLFFDNVRIETETIHEELNAINDPWKGLLKRIVINPLIANAPLISNKITRNKLVTKTSAVIHGQNMDITDIASEAQLTDLQLTLLLSMANRYQWTPWKALLLDDPTQHHDLVHASSVFDVLRDYMTEFDYQVMISTHDSIQAKFFQRKLENEGVPSKIYQLVNRSGGVTAERII